MRYGSPLAVAVVGAAWMLAACLAVKGGAVLAACLAVPVVGADWILDEARLSRVP